MSAWESMVATIQKCTAPSPATYCTPRQAQAVEMRERGATTREIAQHFGISPAGAEQLLWRAATRIKAFELFHSGMPPRKVAEELEISYQGLVQLLGLKKGRPQ